MTQDVLPSRSLTASRLQRPFVRIESPAQGLETRVQMSGRPLGEGPVDKAGGVTTGFQQPPHALQLLHPELRWAHGEEGTPEKGTEPCTRALGGPHPREGIKRRQETVWSKSCLPETQAGPTLSSTISPPHPRASQDLVKPQWFMGQWFKRAGAGRKVCKLRQGARKHSHVIFNQVCIPSVSKLEGKEGKKEGGWEVG